ncbi:putative flippase GtrA [Polymorphobacter multimanifer]|uniref:Putative flippase GtrA n=1 Tax=Polymorphobacter multimanifer TaxID=1070431 RepID=A0A841L0S2_9SPHN|nr:GtrA family protein [Polymorphobacter multimanifer]MBB6226277.1 putative flippase GtrA [Polymorphobacter multimanifer]
MTGSRLARQGSRYLLTGGTAAVVDIGLFWAFTTAGMAIVTAALLSFLIATVVNYRLTSRHVFATPASLRGYAKFLAAAGLGLVLNVALTGLLAANTAMPPLLAKIIAVGIAFVANFLMNALVVFHKPAAQPPSDRPTR